MHSFASDYSCRPHPKVVEAVMNACAETYGSYGADKITQQAEELVRSHFGLGSEAVVCFVSNGTAANRLALQGIMSSPCNSIMCVEDAHIDSAECGAIESLGHKLLTVPGFRGGKIDVHMTERFLRQRSDIHLTYPQVLSIANATELGAVYTLDELELIQGFARDHQLLLHLDGIRLSNAAAHLEVNLQDITGALGANVITYGGTKNGGMMGDVVIFPTHRDPNAVKRLHKQQGQLCARTQCVAAQFIALLTDDLWLRNARQANKMAELLANAFQSQLGLRPDCPVESNAVFVTLPPEVTAKLKAQADFYEWDPESGSVRLMCSWDTTEDDVYDLVHLAKKCLAD